MSVLSPDDARSLSIVLVAAAAEEYARDTRQKDLPRRSMHPELLPRFHGEDPEDLSKTRPMEGAHMTGVHPFVIDWSAAMVLGLGAVCAVGLIQEIIILVRRRRSQ